MVVPKLSHNRYDDLVFFFFFFFFFLQENRFDISYKLSPEREKQEKSYKMLSAVITKDIERSS